MKRYAFAALVFSMAALAGCGGGDEARYEALCRKAGMAEEAVRTMVAQYSEASSEDRADMMKSLQSAIDSQRAAEEDED